MTARRNCPSLVDLCIQTAIDNVRYIGDVGETEVHLLEHILPHCTVEQLAHIERCSEGRDLSLVTDKLWKKFYALEFGANSTDVVAERMNKKNVSFQWRLLYEAKLKVMENVEKESFDRIKELYKKENARKQSRQVQICTKVPPSGSKRGSWGGNGYGLSNVRSNIMKKAKIEYRNSLEVKNLAFIKKNSLQRNHGISPMTKPSFVPRKNSASTSKFSQPKLRRL